jgi:hypothetical protein
MLRCVIFFFFSATNRKIKPTDSMPGWGRKRRKLKLAISIMAMKYLSLPGLDQVKIPGNMKKAEPMKKCQ